MKKREDAAPGVGGLPMGGEGAGGIAAQGAGITVADPVALDRIADAGTFEDRVGAVRGFTRDNPARAALAVRDMISADAKS
jgi:flagellar M-ring protein FliF